MKVVGKFGKSKEEEEEELAREELVREELVRAAPRKSSLTAWRRRGGNQLSREEVGRYCLWFYLISSE